LIKPFEPRDAILKSEGLLDFEQPFLELNLSGAESARPD
jgi:hypothetical protein